MEGHFHVFFSTILDLKTPNSAIKPMNVKVSVGPDEEVVVRTTGKANKLTGLNTEQRWRVHA